MPWHVYNPLICREGRKGKVSFSPNMIAWYGWTLQTMNDCDLLGTCWPVSWFFARCMDAPKLFLLQVKRFYHLFYFWCLIAPPFCRCNQPGIGAAAYGSSILSCGRAHHWALAEQLLRHAEQETLVETWHGWSEAIHGLRGHVSTDRPRIWWMVLLSKIFKKCLSSCCRFSTFEQAYVLSFVSFNISPSIFVTDPWPTT